MKQILVILLVFTVYSAKAQKRVIFGEKAPDISTEQFIINNTKNNIKAKYIEFFVLGSPYSIEQLDRLEEFAQKYGDKINFIIVTKDKSEDLIKFFREKTPAYSVVTDLDGKTFTTYGVKYVPISALIDRKGNFIWQGKTSELTDIIIRNAIH